MKKTTFTPNTNENSAQDVPSIPKKKRPDWALIWKKFSEYILTSMNGMVYGLFSTLIIGVIINQIGLLMNFNLMWFGVEYHVGEEIIKISTFVKSLMGVGIGVGMAIALKYSGLKALASSLAAAIAASTLLMGVADPVATYITTAITLILIDKIFAKKTPFDIILIPLLAVSISFILGKVIVIPVSAFANMVGSFIQTATSYQPFLMGIIVAVLMGIILTSPFSSAAIGISFGIGGLAGGAAVVGCAVNMLGFAVQGRKANSVGTTISVAFGTSMLQFKNVLKKPIIWLPTIIASAILGPFATLVFKTQTDFTGSGMGTSGLVGQFATYAAMGNTPRTWLSIFVLQLILPIFLVYGLDLIFKKAKLYQDSDFII